MRTTDKSASERRNRGLAPWQKRLKDAADSAVVTTRSVRPSGVNAPIAVAISVAMSAGAVMIAARTATSNVEMVSAVTSAAATTLAVIVVSSVVMANVGDISVVMTVAEVTPVVRGTVVSSVVMTAAGVSNAVQTATSVVATMLALIAGVLTVVARTWGISAS